MSDENRLDQFGNSPRAFLNHGQTTTVNSSSLIQLGPGLVATRPIVPEGQSSFMRIDAPNLAQVDSLIERVAALEALENPVDVPWAANIVIDFATLGSRHAVITAEAGTFTLGTPLNTLPGRDYKITLLSGGGGDNAWGAAWDVTTAPWTGLLTNNGTLNGDPQLYTFTFRAFPGPKMRLVGAWTGAE